MPSAELRGGAEEALLQFCRHRDTGRVVVLTVFFLEAGELVEQVRALGCCAEVIQGGRLRQGWVLVAAIWRLCITIRHQAPDVILSWMTKAHIYAGMASRIINIPAVYFQMGLPDRGVVDRISRLVPAIGGLGCSAFVASEQRQLVSHPVETVLLAADLKRFDCDRLDSPKALKKQMGFDPERPLVGIVGRLQRWKGMHVFLKAMSTVTKSLPSADGVIVGGIHQMEPQYLNVLQRNVRDMGLEGRIRLAGAQRNIPEWMQAMDVVVHASDREPFGIVVIEAMALGKPVVATIPGGPAEIITDGQDGLLVNFGDADALAAAITRFLCEPSLSKACGAAAALRARDFAPELFSRQLIAALDRLLSRSLESKIVKV